MADIFKAISQLLWPIISILVIFLFKKEISGLLKRIRKGGNFEFEPVSQLTTSTTNIAFLSTVPRTPATQFLENELLNLPGIKTITDPVLRETALVAIAARALLVFSFIQIDSFIWGSQISLLNHLNLNIDGEKLEFLKVFSYNPASNAFPDLYANYSFEKYINFLRLNNLIEGNKEIIKITQIGREYLVWRVEQRRPLKAYG